MCSHVRQEPSAKSETSTSESPSRRRWTVTSRRLRGRALAQEGQDVGGELLQGVGLVIAREVEDEFVEAEVEVRADALDDLLRVVGDDEARRGLLRVGLGQALHLDRVLDARLLVRRQREGGPRSAVAL